MYLSHTDLCNLKNKIEIMNNNDEISCKIFLDLNIPNTHAQYALAGN